MMCHVPPYDASPQARKPLMKMFWSAQGWRGQPVLPAPPDLARAVAAGVMFDQKRSASHDEWVTQARKAAARTSAQETGDAFLESLSSRRLDLRSALGSYAVAGTIPEHAESIPADQACCTVCNQYPDPEEDLNVLNFERFKWAGVRRTNVRYIAFDLEQFARAPRQGPNTTDLKLANTIFAALRALPPSTTRTNAAKAIDMLPGNRDEREALLDILNACGIWRTKIDTAALAKFLPSLPPVP